MPAASTNRTMFWRIVRRLLVANHARLCVLVLALAAAATITAALLNLQIDARHRLTSEFRAFGPNVIVSPRTGYGGAARDATMSQDILTEIPRGHAEPYVSAEPFLYVTANVSAGSTPPLTAVLVGTTAMGLINSLPPRLEGDPIEWNGKNCAVGSNIASRLRLSNAQILDLILDRAFLHCRAFPMLPAGGPEDNEVFANLNQVQALASLRGRISLIQVIVPGRPNQIESYLAVLSQKLPEVEVHPLRQFTEAEGKIYNRISGLLTATVVLVLVLTALCVMAGMTNAAMERKNDVGLMKAIGGATRRVLRLFIAEAAVLGLVGGVVGAAAGIILSIWLGQAVFGVAARPRLIVYPVAVILTVIVAIAGALPLRRLATIRPASVFRGE
jgi:putative ABC transport system permease protein